jgi:TRAP-type C4-dicarboxylate transport system permease large subunit
MIGLMHPPIGLLLFVVSSVGKLRLGPVMWEVLPFLGWALVVLALTIVLSAHYHLVAHPNQMSSQTPHPSESTDCLIRSR